MIGNQKSEIGYVLAYLWREYTERLPSLFSGFLFYDLVSCDCRSWGMWLSTFHFLQVSGAELDSSDTLTCEMHGGYQVSRKCSLYGI